MKNIFIKNITPVLSVLLILAFASCAKEQTEGGAAGVTSEKILITGSDANAATKTTLNGLVTSWILTTDKVGIYSSQARTATGGGGSAIVNTQFAAASSGISASFNGTMYWGAASTSHTFYAYYPYASGSAAANAVPVSLPSAQTQSAANNTDHIGALDFMIATPVTVTSPSNTNAASGVNLKYNHVFTVLEFQIKGTGQLKAVKLSANGSLAFSGGTIDITQATPATGIAYTLASQTGTSNEAVVTLATPATLTATNTDTKVYMVINPGLQTGNCLIGISTDGTTWKYITKMALSGGFLRGNKYVVSVDASIATEPVDDIDGNTYSTVMIGSQVWMGSNLKTTKYNDGSAISLVSNTTLWSERTDGAYCYYNNSGTNGTIYGALYNWYAVNTGKLCPTGWHVPTSTDWSTLATTLGGGSYAGGKLKETGTTHWTNNNGASDLVGFTALPGGRRKHDGTFEYIGTKSMWWTSTINGTFANYKSIVNTSVSLGGSYDNHKNGYSVRCVKD